MQRSDDHRLAVEYLAKARRELACGDLDWVESTVRLSIDVLEKEAPSDALRGAYVLLGMIVQLGGDLEGSYALFAK
jgi:hypothetical protein